MALKGLKGGVSEGGSPFSGQLGWKYTSSGALLPCRAAPLLSSEARAIGKEV